MLLILTLTGDANAPSRSTLKISLTSVTTIPQNQTKAARSTQWLAPVVLSPCKTVRRCDKPTR